MSLDRRAGTDGRSCRPAGVMKPSAISSISSGRKSRTFSVTSVRFSRRAAASTSASDAPVTTPWPASCTETTSWPRARSSTATAGEYISSRSSLKRAARARARGLLGASPPRPRCRDPGVDLLRVLAVVADRNPHRALADPQSLRERRNEILAALRRATQSGHDLPDIWPPDHNRAPARGPLAEEHARVTVCAEPLLDVALGEARDRLPAASAPLAQRP